MQVAGGIEVQHFNIVGVELLRPLVYLLIGESGALLYVGQSRMGLGRWQGHYKRFNESVRTVVTMPVPDYIESEIVQRWLDFHERLLIFSFKPTGVRNQYPPTMKALEFQWFNKLSGHVVPIISPAAVVAVPIGQRVRHHGGKCRCAICDAAIREKMRWIARRRAREIDPEFVDAYRQQLSNESDEESAAGL